MSPAHVTRLGSVRRRGALRFGLVMALAFGAVSAHGFRPSSRWVLDQAVLRAKKAKMRTLVVEADLYRFDEDDRRGRLGTETLWLESPFHVRRTRTIGAETWDLWRTKTEERTSTPQGSRTGKVTPSPLWRFLLVGEGIDRRIATERLLKELETLGVDLDVVSYARFDGRVMYLVGSKPWETDKSQIWFDKDTLRLARVRLVKPGASEGEMLTTDVHLLGYGSPEGGAWYPKTVERFDNGRLLWRAVTRSVDKNVDVEDAVFALPKGE